MKVLHDWLKDYIGEGIPSAEKIEELLTFHSFEIEGVEVVGDHTVIDVDVLPNRSSNCLSHRGISRELATLSGTPLAHDPFRTRPDLPTSDRLKITIEDSVACRHFDLAFIIGITVQPSPDWLRERLEALGQRSINNVVDATNYVMLGLGQPLHAYDAEKFETKDDQWHFRIRFAREGETITTLTGETYELDPTIQLIVNGGDDSPAGIAGIKGGKYAEVDEKTTTIVLEAASFDPAVTRKAAQKLKLQTDASKRFENDLSSEIAPYALHACATLISEIAGGTVEGYGHAHPTVIENTPVAVTLEHINTLLGLSLTSDVVEDIYSRLGFSYEREGEKWQVVAPFERTDIRIAEDVIEEVGRVYGYKNVEAVIPAAVPLTEINQRQYYSDQIRNVLTGLGYSEVITSSFRKKDELCLRNALASDKGCLRSSLRKNIEDALTKNIPNIDLLGIQDVRIFEIGTVFRKATEMGITEYVSVCMGVRVKGQGYTPKDDVLIAEALAALSESLGVSIAAEREKGTAEFNLTTLLQSLPHQSAYGVYEESSSVSYQPFSLYPFIARDIALWVPETASVETVREVLNTAAGDLRKRTALFDEFKKDGRVSYAFRIVFQSDTKTLTDTEVNAIMDRITEAAAERGWEVR